MKIKSSNTGDATTALATASSLLARAAAEGYAQQKPENILKATVAVTGVTIEQLKGGRGTPAVALARQLAMVILREGGMTLAEVGSLTGDRDHGTVIHAVKKIDELLEIEKRMPHQPVATLMELIRAKAKRLAAGDDGLP